MPKLDLHEEQLKLEEQSDRMTINRFHAELQAKTNGGEESSTYYGSALMKRAIAPMIVEISTFIVAASSTRAGPKHSAVKYLEQVSPDVAAFITSKVVLDNLTQRPTAPRLAVAIGAAIEHEVMYQEFQKDAPGLWSVLKRQTSGENNRRKRSILKHTYQKFVGDWDSWGDRARVHLGMKMLELYIEATGFVQMTFTAEGTRKRVNYIDPTEVILKWIAGTQAKAMMLNPVYLPMVVKPMAWTSPFDGGYLTPRPSPMALIKTSNRAYLSELAEMPEQLSDVYESVNAIQEVPWKINTDVLAVAEALWERGIAVANLPESEELPLPIFKHDGIPKDDWTEQQQEDFKDFKAQATETHQYNARLRSRRIQTTQIISIAQQFKKYPSIFFPQKLDFRGRVYSVPMFLNPQGTDIAKSLLTFSEGKRIGAGSGAGWLAIQGANTFGYDKATLDDRIEWAASRSDQIRAIADNPLSDLWWTEADSPWGFLAFCFEWAGYLKDGEDHITHLPVALDGSCSGLQHFSAALRDDIGGAAVNLVPSEVPSDVYQEVADLVIAKLRLDLTISEKTIMAQSCLDFGIDRKTTKRSTMTLPYGSSLYSCKAFVLEWIKEKAEKVELKGEENVLKGIEMEASKYLGSLVWDSIGEVVIAARDAMEWLRKTASVVCKEEQPLLWTTPDGLPIMQEYRNMKARRVETKFGQKLVYVTLSEKQDKLDSRRQANGVAPNWVHSMDATHLRMVVLYGKDNGLNSFAVIHDSFGTHACDTDMLSSCLREALVDLYSGDVLQDFKDEVTRFVSNTEDLPDLPARGNLNLETIKQSDFVFA